MRHLYILLLAVLLCGCASQPQNRRWVSGYDMQAIATAVNHADRPEADRSRDTARLPAQVLGFFAVKPEMTVADLMAGGGYYTEVLNHLVGDKGKVYAQNNSIALKRFADKAMTERLKDGRLSRVIRKDRELEDPGLPEGQLDVVMMVLFYHDSYWMKVDRQKMNAAIFKALKPGGVYAVIDHHAQAGSGQRDVQTLHRVDAELVKTEILEAGFVLEAESDLLRNPNDERTINVFKPEIRGKTDRFIYRFAKPW
jgi:predicted methyltransferase